MADLDFILKEEIPFQCYNQDKIQVVLPVHPCLFDLPDDVRMDHSIPEQILETLAEEYEADMNAYMPSLTPEQIGVLGLERYVSFHDAWSFHFRKSETGLFLDTVWDDGGTKRMLGYIQSPVVVCNGQMEHGRLCTPEEMYGTDMSLGIWYPDGNPSSDLIIFQREKFDRFRRTDVPIFGEIVDKGNFIETAIHAFCSHYLDNVAQGLVLRNFGVKYLNALVRKAHAIVECN